MFVCLCVCLFVRVFLGHFETDWDALWHNVDFYFGKGSKTIIYLKSFFKELVPLFYISDFSVNLKNDYRKTKVGRNLILFAYKLTGHRAKFIGKILLKRDQVFVMPV